MKYPEPADGTPTRTDRLIIAAAIVLLTPAWLWLLTKGLQWIARLVHGAA